MTAAPENGPPSEGEKPPEGTAPPPPASPPAEGAPLPPAAEPEPSWATRYKYLLAEFDNFRKRTERERDRLRQESRAIVLRELLSFHDAVTEAESAAATRPANDPFRRGVELLLREWRRFLAGEGVEPVARAGEPFHPSEEEAVGEVPAASDHPDGTVAEVVQQGYRCPAGLLRPAKVLVARAGPAPPPTELAKPGPEELGIPQDSPEE